MFVTKRNGTSEKIIFDKISTRIERLCTGLDANFVDYAKITIKVIDGLYSGVTTCELDTLAAETCAVMSTVHPDYGVLAARIFVSNLHKETSGSFSSVVETLFKHKNPVSGKWMPLVNEDFYNDVIGNYEFLDSIIDYTRDYGYTYFGLKTLERAYLLRIGDRVVERPQHLIMRVAVALHGRDNDRILETYNAMSNRYFIHATPTLFNSGTMRQGLSSCFLLTAKAEDDSIENIFRLLGECAVISKYSGGIGMSIHDIRAKGSLIASTNGKSEGIVPLMGVFNKSAKYVTQSNKRPGSIAVYLEPWHAEIFEFIKLKENAGLDELRARDLFYGLWIPDLFMEKAKADDDWCLFCPNEAPGLAEVYGDQFVSLYNRYEVEGRFRRKVKARQLLYEIIESQVKTGGPYMLYKDAVNRKNNQKHMGTVRSSNLCVSPETRILTSTGYHRIVDLVDKQVLVWNGSQFSSTTVKKTSDSSKLKTVKFSNGSFLECTSYHKFHLVDGTIKETKDLTVGDELLPANFPVSATKAAMSGYGQDYYNLGHTATASSQVPTNGSIEDCIRFLSGVFDAHLRVVVADTDGNDSTEYRLELLDFLFLHELQFMIQRLGVDVQLSDIGYMRGTLSLTSWQIADLNTLGLHTRVVKLTNVGEVEPEPLAPIKISITAIEDNGRVSATYCFNEPIAHRGVFNGVLTGNCTEITQYTSSEEVAVCNLASMGLPSYVITTPGEPARFDFQMLYKMTKVVTRNLEKVIDLTHYPVAKARYSNLRHRPMGVGVSGLADTFCLMRFPFDSPEAKKLNKEIFETIYFAAVEASCEMAAEFGPYETYQGSEFSNGRFQWDLWGLTSDDHSGMWDWEALRLKVFKHGMRNSLLTSPMPTASTSQIIGFTEAFEPLNSNIYKRQTLSGEFQIVNRMLLKDLCELGIWNDMLKQKIITNKGSVQGIPEIPAHIQTLYKTSWELSQKVVMDLCADRGVYVDQSQSMNIFMAEPTYKKLMSMHFYGWEKGLKTGMYYLKMKSATAPLQVTMGQTESSGTSGSDKKDEEEVIACSRDNKDCLACSA